MAVAENIQRDDKGLKSSSPSLESFEETYKTAYSHGLEEIYSLKTVDFKTVRRIHETKPEEISVPEESASPSHEDSFADDEQLEMDLGDSFRGWIEPFLVREPIKVLKLSHNAELCLSENGILLLQDLIGQDLQELGLLKGIGQGHVDEIQKKLSSYIGSRSIKHSFFIEFSSWLKSIFVGIDSKKAAVFLHRFGLEDLITLTTAEGVEVKYLDPQIKEQWINECYVELRAEGRVREIHEDMSRVVNVFIIPWMCGRLFKATQAELVERLEKVSDSTQWVHLIMNFFSVVYCDNAFPFSKYLPQVEEGVLCCGGDYAAAYREIIERALTYFYNPSAHYTTHHLVGLLAREFAQEWKDLPDEWISAALRFSSKFRARKGPSGELEIKLA